MNTLNTPWPTPHTKDIRSKFVFFQILDDKSECVGIYKEGNLVFTDLPEDLTHTWSYSGFLKGKNIEYAKIYCQGENIR